MLSFQTFRECVIAGIPRFQTDWLNPEQEGAVAAPQHPPTFIVAGPGTGKTTVLALRVLKLILVDGFRPNGILATTFTRKAAAELRSRVLSWGFSILEYARGRTELTPLQLQWLNRLDINAVRIGTLDALCGDILADNKLPGEIPAATVERLIAQGIMRRHGFFAGQRQNNADLTAYLSRYVPAFPGAASFRVQLDEVVSFAERVRHDQIDFQAFARAGAGEAVLKEVVDAYDNFLNTNHLADFATLESMLLERIRSGQLDGYVNLLQAVLVDEFQDTNYLQEQIYFALCGRSGASLTVVGDDDQSIFRFRGATVELFAAFQTRVTNQLGAQWSPTRVNLVRNYRSNVQIVNFCNRFVQLDNDYQGARAPGKLALICADRTPIASVPPILAMFRDTSATLAHDLAEFLTLVFRGNGVQVTCGNNTFAIAGAAGGDFGDAVLLASSVREFTHADPPRARLPILLRRELEQLHVSVFNPRGRSLFEIESVRLLLGLAMLCIDNSGAVLQSITAVRPSSRLRLQAWRTEASQFATRNPNPPGLSQFIAGWRTKTPGPGMQRWPSEWPLLELLFSLVTWLPDFQDSPEGQVYLEAIARTIGEAGQFSTYGARILHGRAPHADNSVKAALREVFVAVADEDVTVDEEIMPHVPRNYFPIMTVHQAKGLEFPLVIVDVGSDFRTNHQAQIPQRFPAHGGQLHRLEDLIAPYSPVGPSRLARTQLQRAWDDIRRLYYVAYSRPHDVLLLVGLTSQVGRNPTVRSVATGDLSNGSRSFDFTPAAGWLTTMPAGSVALI